MTTETLPTAEALADEFIRVMRTWLTVNELILVDARNADEPPRSNVCHTHDFCDANMAMDEALTNLGTDLFRDGEMREDVGALWDSAWELAIKRGFAVKH